MIKINQKALRLMLSIALAVLLTGTGVGLAVHLLRQAPPLESLFGVQPQSSVYHFYQPQVGSKTTKPSTSVDHLDGNRKSVTSSYQTLPDGSPLMIHLNSDTVLSSEQYYPRQPRDGSLHLHIAKKFGGRNGVGLTQEDRLFPDGAYQYIGRRVDDDTYHISTYFNEGLIESDLAALTYANAPYLIDQVFYEKRWSSKETGHQLIYENAPQPDKSHIITTWDLQHRVVRLVKTFKRGYNGDGTTVVEYCPGSTVRKRLDAITESSMTTAKFFRCEDGSLEMIKKLWGGTVQAEHFARDGKTPLFKQKWSIYEIYNSELGRRTETHLAQVWDHPDGHGHYLREMTIYANGQVMIEVWNDRRKLNGILCSEFRNFYRTTGSPEEMGTLSKQMCIPNALGIKTQEVEHAASEQIKIQVTAEEMKPIDLSQDLPVPPAQDGPP